MSVFVDIVCAHARASALNRVTEAPHAQSPTLYDLRVVSATHNTWVLLSATQRLAVEVRNLRERLRDDKSGMCNAIKKRVLSAPVVLMSSMCGFPMFVDVALVVRVCEPSSPQHLHEKQQKQYRSSSEDKPDMLFVRA